MAEFAVGLIVGTVLTTMFGAFVRAHRGSVAPDEEECK